MLFLAIAAAATLVVTFTIFSVIGDNKEKAPMGNDSRTPPAGTPMECIPTPKHERSKTVSNDYAPMGKSKEIERKNSR